MRLAKEIREQEAANAEAKVEAQIKAQNARIAKAMLAKGMSVADVAECVGLSASEISTLSQP